MPAIRRLIEACQTSNSIRTLALTTEEEALGLGRRRVAGRPAVGDADAELGRGQHHQPDGSHQDAALSVPDPDHDARRVWRVQFLAVPDGQGTPKVLEAMGVLVYSSTRRPR